MLTLFGKYSIAISLLLLLGVLLVAWLLPTSGLGIGIILLLFSLVLAVVTVFEKHRKTYFEGRITHVTFRRNLVFDVAGILLAVIMAGILSRYLAGIAAGQIPNDITRLIVGIMIGLVVGIAVGMLINRASSRLAGTSSQNRALK
jgi:hypothetical protein